MAELIPCDLHIHPDYSVDSNTSIEKYCVRAQQLNIPVIGFTTHFDINPARDDIDPFMNVDGEKVRVDDYAIGRYIDDCLAAREQFPDLQVLIGMEIDYFLGVESEIYRLKNEFDFDYMIGSVHNLEGANIASKREAPGYFNSHSLDKMADNYFELLYNAANCGLFNVIGHPDYYLRHGTIYYGQEIFEIHRERLARVIEAAKRTGTGFEINTSYKRHGGDSFFPQPDFISTAMQLGAEFNSIGSDSHKLEHLGEGIPEAIRTVSEMGVKLHLFYENR